MGLPWSFMGRIDTSSREQIEMFVDSGCVGMRFGIESFHQRLLDAVNKRLDAAKSWDTCNWILTRFRGIHVRLLTMTQLPGETAQDEAEDSRKFNHLQVMGNAWGNKVDIQSAPCIALPGTELWRQMVAAGHKGEMENFEEHNPLREGTPLQARLKVYQEASKP